MLFDQIIDKLEGLNRQAALPPRGRELLLHLPMDPLDRGRISDEFDIVEYRDMVTIVRDRVAAMIAKGRTLDQIEAARPTLP